MDKNKVTHKRITKVRGNNLNTETNQTYDMDRKSGVSEETTGAENIWFGKVTTPPGSKSGAHHHGEAETGGYILSGHTRIYFGENYEQYEDFGPGDFVYVPPFTPHIERNLSEIEPVIFLTCRTPSNIVVNLEDIDKKITFNERGK